MDQDQNLASESQLTPPVTSEQVPIQTVPKTKIARVVIKWFLIVLSIPVVLFGLMVIYFIFNGSTPEKTISILNTEVLPSTVSVICYGDNDKKDVQRGTGSYFILNGKPSVMTNSHVILNNGIYHGCEIYFPTAEGLLYELKYPVADFKTYHDLVSDVDGEKSYGLDYAVLTLDDTKTDSDTFPPNRKDVRETLDDLCDNLTFTGPVVGDQVYILGYPAIGGDSITMTNGIVSGFLGKNNQWLKLSAVANHGTSGGLVVGVNGCYYGMLTMATFADGSNIGIALYKDYIDSFISAATDEKTVPGYLQDPKKLDLEGEYKVGDLTLDSPKDWKISTSTSNVKLALVMSAPREDAVDAYSEFFGVYKEDSDKYNLDTLYNEELKSWDRNEKISGPVGSKIKISGITAYKIEGTTKIDGYIIKNRTIMFVYNGNLYSIYTFQQGDSVYSSSYDYIFENIISKLRVL